jgi:hypothetical protein
METRSAGKGKAGDIGIASSFGMLTATLTPVSARLAWIAS